MRSILKWWCACALVWLLRSRYQLYVASSCVWHRMSPDHSHRDISKQPSRLPYLFETSSADTSADAPTNNGSEDSAAISCAVILVATSSDLSATCSSQVRTTNTSDSITKSMRTTPPGRQEKGARELCELSVSLGQWLLFSTPFSSDGGCRLGQTKRFELWSTTVLQSSSPHARGKLLRLHTNDRSQASQAQKESDLDFWCVALYLGQTAWDFRERRTGNSTFSCKCSGTNWASTNSSRMAISAAIAFISARLAWRLENGLQRGSGIHLKQGQMVCPRNRSNQLSKPHDTCKRIVVTCQHTTENTVQCWRNEPKGRDLRLKTSGPHIDHAVRFAPGVLIRGHLPIFDRRDLGLVSSVLLWLQSMVHLPLPREADLHNERAWFMGALLLLWTALGFTLNWRSTQSDWIISNDSNSGPVWSDAGLLQPCNCRTDTTPNQRSGSHLVTSSAKDGQPCDRAMAVIVWSESL